MTSLDNVLWIGGAQWAGKSTVTTLLAARYPVATYRYDYHDARSHMTRALADPSRFPMLNRFLRDLEADPDLAWVKSEPEQMAETARRIFLERFALVREDLELMPAGVSVIAEGWGLRPELISPLLSSTARAVFIIPTNEFRERQLRDLDRARSFSFARLSDLMQAQRNRVERDTILAHDVASNAVRLGLPLIMVDGSIDEAGVATIVEEQFRPFLPRWLY